ncbi:hypothetical protein [Streptomyces sp. NPDC091215]|uniref:hypothetical protein n=1 Tax=Streptomyces sp. NPDC091215 TaxID=3155192 RepID=UPI00341FE7B9
MTAVIDRPRAAQRPRVADAITRLARHTADHARATAQRLSGSLLTAMGLGCIDVGAFEANTIAGWITTGITVLLLDWKLE